MKSIAEQILNLSTETECMSIEKMVLACEQKSTLKESTTNGAIYTFADDSRVESDNDWGLDFA